MFVYASSVATACKDGTYSNDSLFVSDGIGVMIDSGFIAASDNEDVGCMVSFLDDVVG